MSDDGPKDPTVKDLMQRGEQPLEQVVDAETAAQLARWFGLPSFAQVEAGEVKPAELTPAEQQRMELDAEIAEVRKRRQRILDELDPALIAGLERRRTPPPDLLKFQPAIDPINTNITLMNLSGLDGEGPSIGDPREYERPEEISDLLAENTPQALLRDLHRPEYDPSSRQLDQFENPDFDEAPREPHLVDVHGQVEQVMKQRYWIEPFEFPKMGALLDELHQETRGTSWTELPKRLPMPNRRIQE